DELDVGRDGDGGTVILLVPDTDVTFETDYDDPDELKRLARRCAGADLAKPGVDVVGMIARHAYEGMTIIELGEILGLPQCDCFKDEGGAMRRMRSWPCRCARRGPTMRESVAEGSDP
ncbi:hypothetical protein LCGC14_2348850, partial [marine sediment metagenome]